MKVSDENMKLLVQLHERLNQAVDLVSLAYGYVDRGSKEEAAFEALEQMIVAAMRQAVDIKAGVDNA